MAASPVIGSSGTNLSPVPQLGQANSTSTSNPVLLQNPYAKTMGQSEQTSQGQYGNLVNAIQGAGNNMFGPQGYYSQAMGQLNQTGKSAEQQLAQQGQIQQGQAMNNAVNRGLGNSTIANSMQQAVQNNTNMADVNLQSQLAGQKAGLLQNEGGQELNYANSLGQAIASPLATGASPMLSYLADLIGAQKGESSANQQTSAYEPAAGDNAYLSALTGGV